MKEKIFAIVECRTCPKKFILNTDSGIMRTYMEILVFIEDAVGHVRACAKKNQPQEASCPSQSP